MPMTVGGIATIRGECNMGGSGTPSVPKPSKEERALQQQQAELLSLQRQQLEDTKRQNAVLLPFLAQQEGYQVTTDDRGNITGISRADTEADTQTKEIEKLFRERSLAALKGELPTDPALEKDLEVQEQELKSRMQAQFGPGWETSSPGIESMEQFRRTAEILRSGARTGQLTLAEQLGITREQQSQFSRQSSQDMLRQTAIADPLTFAGAFGQTARGYGQAQIPYMQQRGMQFQASAAGKSNMYNLIGAGIGAAGSAMGGIGAAGGMAAFFSDRRGKKDFIKISETLDGIPIYTFTHLGTGEKMIGVMSDDVAKVRPYAVGRRFGHDTVRYSDVT